jgi:flagellar biosynthesis/type III secretory pathway chaperone
MRIVESNQAERIANELATLLAQEHQLLVQEQEKRAQLEAIASDLAVQLALDRAELAREREARERAEAQASELSTLIIGDVEEERSVARFVPADSRGTRRFQRVS